MTNTTYGSPYVQSSDLVSGWPATSLAVADRIDDVSFKGNGLNNQTASYTGVLTDAGKTIMMNVASANDFTIPASGTVAYELGTMLRVSNKGAGVTTVKPNGGVVLNGGNITLAQYQSATVQLVAADIWSPVAIPAPTAAAAGLTLINATSFSAVSSVSINNCFTTAYDYYRIIVRLSGGGSASALNFQIRMRAGGTDATGTDYDNVNAYGYGATAGAEGNTSQTLANLGAYLGTEPANFIFDVTNPAQAVYTYMNGTGAMGHPAVGWLVRSISARHRVSAAYDGLTLSPASSTFTGTVRVYGYQNS